MPGDLEKSVADYRRIAAQYDHATRRINGIRREAVAALNLQPGETVIDAGCGSGFSFAPILQAIGPAGLLLAFDHSAELLRIARGRIEDGGWKNVVLLEATAETVDFRAALAGHAAAAPTALLFSYLHDVLQSETALDNLFARAAPRARVVACGTKLWPWWGLPVNLYLYVTHRNYITNRNENFAVPWKKLATRMENFKADVRWPPGWRYLASGTLRFERKTDLLT